MNAAKDWFLPTIIIMVAAIVKTTVPILEMQKDQSESEFRVEPSSSSSLSSSLGIGYVLPVSKATWPEHYTRLRELQAERRGIFVLMSSRCIKEGGSRWVRLPMMLRAISLSLLSSYDILPKSVKKISPNENASSSSLTSFYSRSDSSSSLMSCLVLFSLYSLEIWNLPIPFKDECDLSSLRQLQLDPVGISLWFEQKWSWTIVSYSLTLMGNKEINVLLQEPGLFFSNHDFSLLKFCMVLGLQGKKESQSIFHNT